MAAAVYNLLIIAILLSSAVFSSASPAMLTAAQFGLLGDGRTDDGPALARAVSALQTQAPPAVLKFEAGKTYRIRTAPGTWVFSLRGLRDVTLDGSDCTFVLDPHLRFIHLNSCTNAVVRGFALDFDPLPFADGTVTAADAVARTVDVKVADGFALPPLGGPTREKEQAYFAMLWHPSPHGLTSEHLFLADTREAYPGSLRDRVIRVIPNPDFTGFAGLRTNLTRISLPVRGIAHKMFGFGASPAVVIEENDTVLCENVQIWSAPLFGVNLARNRGSLVFRHVDIRPKPGSGRLTSTWRDGFHVKGNYASLLFEDCHLEGMNDDAFNIATHSSGVVSLPGTNTVKIRQTFPLAFVPFLPGDQVMAYSVSEGRLLGPATVTAGVPEKPVDTDAPSRPAVPLTITLDPPLPALKPGDIVWNQSSANPNTVLRRCTIGNSCRFQSSVTLDACDITAFCWFYGDNLEGPQPAKVEIRNSRLRAGRGNPKLAASFTSRFTGPGGKPALPRQPATDQVRLAGNTIDGRLDIGYVKHLTLESNRFLLPGSRLTLRHTASANFKNNLLGRARLDRPGQVDIPDSETRQGLRFED